MIKSMTGYGIAKGLSGKQNIVVEIKSINNRFLDCSVKIPHIYLALEDGIKSQVQKSISRGKVDVYITIDSSLGSNVTVNIDEDVADSYMHALNLLSEKYGIENNITAVELAEMQDVLHITKAEENIDEIGNCISELLNSALEDFNLMRCREGSKLKEDILTKADEIERLTKIIELRSPETIAEYRQRLTKKINEVLENKSYDDSLILSEVAIFADKVSVDEETVRLHSHIDQLRHLLESNDPVGRKMDFLVQEFNREANTIGSKCNDLELSHVVVAMKSEIEKIREQVQNIE